MGLVHMQNLASEANSAAQNTTNFVTDTRVNKLIIYKIYRNLIKYIKIYAGRLKNIISKGNFGVYWDLFKKYIFKTKFIKHFCKCLMEK